MSLTKYSRCSFVKFSQWCSKTWGSYFALWQKENLDANTRNTLANARVTEQTGVDLAKSVIGSNKANARNANANAKGYWSKQVLIWQILKFSIITLLDFFITRCVNKWSINIILIKTRCPHFRILWISMALMSLMLPIVLAALQSIAAGLLVLLLIKLLMTWFICRSNLIKSHIDNIISARNSIMNIIK